LTKVGVSNGGRGSVLTFFANTYSKKCRTDPDARVTAWNEIILEGNRLLVAAAFAENNSRVKFFLNGKGFCGIYYVLNE